MAACLRSPPAAAVAAKTHLYIFEKGFLYACPGLASESIRFTASVQLSRHGQPFEVEVKGHRARATGFVVRPGVWRRTLAAKVPLVSIGLSVANPWFRTISTLKTPHALLPLSCEDFADHDEAIEAACEGELTAEGAKALSDAVMSRVAARLPAPRPLDARIQRVLWMVEENFRVPLNQLAEDAHVSYHRLSHLFSDTMGLALRSYVLSRKLDFAFKMARTNMTLTEIAFAAGFSDAAHFSRIWMRSAGAPPSYFLNNNEINVRSSFSGD